MGENLTRKLIAAHLAAGKMQPGTEIALRIDQTLTQDATYYGLFAVRSHGCSLC